MNLKHKLAGLALASTLGIAGASIPLPTDPTTAYAADTNTSATSEQVNNGQFTLTKLNDTQSKIMLSGATFVQQDNDVKIQSQKNDFSENISEELAQVKGAEVKIVDNTTAIVTWPKEKQQEMGNHKRQTRSLDPDTKCFLGALGGELVAGSAAVLGVASAPLTLGVGTAVGLTAAATIGGAASGAAANC